MAIRNIKLTALDGSPIDSADLSADFRSSEKVGPFWVGQAAFYYRSGPRKHVIPLAVIDKVLTQIDPVITHVDTGPLKVNVYRLILFSQDIQLASIRTENEEQVEKVKALLKDRIPDLEQGFKYPD